MKRKLQVFVSSTFTDLVEERQAAVSAILKAGHIPAGMELFTAGDKSQMVTITRWIDESDIYMLILGGRYGSVEASSGVSYTELEYEYASNSGKPLFAVVITDDALEEKVKSGGTSFMEKENPALLKAFRERVLTNVSSFFADTKDIKLCVHESLSDFSADKKLLGWVSASEIEDTALLHEEIRSLRSENETLRGQISQSEKIDRAKPSEQRSKQISDIIELLNAQEIEVPSNVSGTVTRNSSLFELFYSNRAALVSGVTNGYGTSDVEQFFYFKLCPALQIHGLVENEKVAGVKYRRSFVSKLGMEVLAECDRNFAKKKLGGPTAASDAAKAK